MQDMPQNALRFGPFHLDLRERLLLRDGKVVSLRGKVFDTLCLLVQHAGSLVRKEELLQRIWPETVVEENNLNHNISILRKALGEKATGQAYIETVPRMGYRFVAPVTETSAEVPAPEPPDAIRQQIRFCEACDGVRIAYSTTGSGYPLVKAANWLNHLEFEWNSPIWRHWLKELGRHHMLIRYDERGNGLSDWNVHDLSFASWVHDLETVVDASGVNQFALLGISQGGAVAAAYAARHPERVRHLILYGAYARGWELRGDPEDVESRQALLTLMRLGWGKTNAAFRQLWTSRFLPDATPEQWAWFNELQRISTSPANAARFLQEFGHIDVTGLLPSIRVPTIVFHCEQDGAIPFEEGRRLAAAIPGARFVPLPSRNHLVLADEPAWKLFVDELGRFLDWHRSAGATH